MVMRWGKRARCKRPDVGFHFHEAPRIDESTDTGNRRAVPGTGVEGIGVGVYGLGEDKVLEMDNCNDCTKMYLKPPNWVLKNNYDGNTSCYVYFTRVKATDLKNYIFQRLCRKNVGHGGGMGLPGRGTTFLGLLLPFRPWAHSPGGRAWSSDVHVVPPCGAGGRVSTGPRLAQKSGTRPWQ